MVVVSDCRVWTQLPSGSSFRVKPTVVVAIQRALGRVTRTGMGWSAGGELSFWLWRVFVKNTLFMQVLLSLVELLISKRFSSKAKSSLFFAWVNQ